MTELVSVIIPVNNGAPFLAETIDSVLSQTWPAIELIVVDDGSVDGTPEIIASYRRRIRDIRQPQSGVGASRNAGLRMATGPFLALLDADDVWLPEKITTQMTYLRSHPRTAGCVTFAQNFFTGMAPVLGARLDAPVPGYSMSALLGRRSLFDRVGEMDQTTRTADSIEWFIRARELGESIDLLPDILVRRRLHSTNLSRRSAGLARQELIDAVKGALDRSRERSRSQPSTQ